MKAIIFVEKLLNINRFQFNNIDLLSFDDIHSFKQNIILNHHLFSNHFFRISNKNDIIKKCNSFHNNQQRIKTFLIELYNQVSPNFIKFSKKNVNFFIYDKIGIIGKKEFYSFVLSNNIQLLNPVISLKDTIYILQLPYTP